MKIDPRTNRMLGNTASNVKAGIASAAPVALAKQLGASTPTSLSASSFSDFDTAKVERIRSAIDNGTYQVNPATLADGLLAHARAFLSGNVS